MISIDPSSINKPSIKISEGALSQIKLALENDPYTKNKKFRVHISGKGCDGFSYNTFFDSTKHEDISVNVHGIEIIMAPFTAYYCQQIKIDYLINYESNEEGFLVENFQQKDFAGKFWRENPEKTPSIS